MVEHSAYTLNHQNNLPKKFKKNNNKRRNKGQNVHWSIHQPQQKLQASWIVYPACQIIDKS